MTSAGQKPMGNANEDEAVEEAANDVAPASTLLPRKPPSVEDLLFNEVGRLRCETLPDESRTNHIRLGAPKSTGTLIFGSDLLLLSSG